MSFFDWVSVSTSLSLSNEYIEDIPLFITMIINNINLPDFKDCTKKELRKEYVNKISIVPSEHLLYLVRNIKDRSYLPPEDIISMVVFIVGSKLVYLSNNCYKIGDEGISNVEQLFRMINISSSFLAMMSYKCPLLFKIGYDQSNHLLEHVIRFHNTYNEFNIDVITLLRNKITSILSVRSRDMTNTNNTFNSAQIQMGGQWYVIMMYLKAYNDNSIDTYSRMLDIARDVIKMDDESINSVLRALIREESSLNIRDYLRSEIV